MRADERDEQYPGAIANGRRRRLQPLDRPCRDVAVVAGVGRLPCARLLDVAAILRQLDVGGTQAAQEIARSPDYVHRDLLVVEAAGVALGAKVELADGFDPVAALA